MHPMSAFDSTRTIVKAISKNEIAFYTYGTVPCVTYISNILPIFFLALFYHECTAFLPNLHTRQKRGTATDALRKS